MSVTNYDNFVAAHFVDPVPTLTDIDRYETDTEFNDRRVMITGNKRKDESRIGEVVGLNPTTGRTLVTNGTNAWFSDINGNHVIGPLSISPSYGQRRESVMAMQEGGRWIYGVVDSVRGAGSITEGPRFDNRGFVIAPWGTSDGSVHFRSTRTGDTSNTRVHALHIFRAAPWAEELFPRHFDSMELVQLKLELAKKNWDFRRAQYGLQIEAMHRDWHNFLPDLEAAGFGLPAATKGFLVSAGALLPVRTGAETLAALQAPVLSASANDLISGLRSRGASVSESLTAMTRVNFTIPVSTSAVTNTEATNTEILAAFRRRFSETPSGLMDVSQSRFVNTLNSTTAL